MERTAEDAALLERALREGWASDRAELRELFGRRPDWAALLEEAQGIPAAQGADAQADRRLVDELLALARTQRVPSPRLRARRPWLGWFAAAAALCLAVGGWWWSVGPASHSGLDGDQLLGANPGSGSEARVSCVRPTGVVSAFDHFEWSADRELEPDESYTVVVYRVDDSGGTLGELQRTSTRELFWEPEPGDVALWPQRIRWRVRRVTSDGARTGSAEALAQR